MKKILLIVGTVLGIILIALAALPFLVPSSVYANQIEKAASDALGRQVTIAGDARLSIFPVISATVKDVTVANPEGFEEPNMIEASALRGSVRLLPLLSRRVEVSELSFEDATVRLTRLEDGTPNWTFATTDTSGQEVEDEEPSSGGDPFAASIDRASLRNAALIFEDWQSGLRYELTEFDAETSLTSAKKPMSLKARGKFQQEPFELNITLATPQALMGGSEATIDANFGSSLGNVTFDGRLSPAEPISLTGQFSADVPRLKRVQEFLVLDLPVDVEPLGGISASGRIDGEIPALRIDFDELRLSGEGLNASFAGELALGDTPSLDGTISLAVRDAYGLSEQLGLNQPTLQPLRQISANARLEGAIDGLSLESIDFKSNSPNLSASYAGAASFADGGSVDGNISIKSDQLRTLASYFDVDLPQGEDLNSAAFAGQATGSFERISIRSGSFALDDTRVTGTLTADLSARVPSLQADLTVSKLDLSAFLGQDNVADSAENSPTEGWSDEPLDLAALKALNADLSLKAAEVVLGNIVLRDTDIQAVINDGALDATLNQVSAFGGAWTGNAIVDTSIPRPTFKFGLSADKVQARELLDSTAGFDKLSGLGLVTVDFSSAGLSLQDIVSSMNGTLFINLDSGALAGVNLGQLVRTAASLQQLIGAGNLTAESFGNAVSPQSQTDFTSFASTLNVQDGVAQIQNLSLINSVLDVKGSGKIDLGARSMDVRLVPAFDRSGQGASASSIQVDGIPVPLRVHGDWVSPKFAPDLSAVRSALTEKARGKAADELQNAIGGDLGSIVSGVVSGNKPQARDDVATPANPASEDQTDDANDTNQESSEPPAKDSEKDAREQALKQVLSTILKPRE